MLICWIRERLPSLMSIAMLTWLFGMSVTLRVHLHAVLAAGVVLVGEEPVHLVERGLVEDLALGETDVAQRLLEVRGLDVLVAGDA